MDDTTLYSYYLQKGTLTYNELAALINAQEGTDLSAEALRQRIRRYKLKAEKIGHGESGDSIFRELEMAKQVFRDERNAWTRQNREQARTEANLDELQSRLLDISGNLFPSIRSKKTLCLTKKSMLILLTDWHIGQTFQNAWGTYSTEIAKARLSTFLTTIEETQRAERCEAAYVMSLGDMINGSIRRTVQLQNRENLVEQVKTASELISNFIYSILPLFPDIYYTGCAGNHTRIVEQKEDALKDERLDSLIDWVVSLLLSKQKHFHYIKPVDATIARFDIYDHVIIGVHGDYDRDTKSGVAGLITKLHVFPSIIAMGHLHTPAYNEESGIAILRGGSLAGAGDDYTTQKRLTGRASQMIAIITEDGLQQIRPVYL